MHADGRELLRSPPLAQLPADTGLDGELVVWESERLAFERLQLRLARRGKGAREAAGQWPAHYVAFALVHVGGTDLTNWTYRRQYFTLDGTDHASHKEQGSMIRRYIIRRNNGLLTSKRRGTWVYYRVEPSVLAHGPTAGRCIGCGMTTPGRPAVMPRAATAAGSRQKR